MPSVRFILSHNHGNEERKMAFNGDVEATCKEKARPKMIL